MGRNETTAKDNRPNCKYGTECYQTNPTHLEKYRHPSKKPTFVKDSEERPSKKAKTEETQVEEIVEQKKSPLKTSPKPRETISDSESDSEDEVIPDSLEEAKKEHEFKDTDPKTLIKEKFLLDMPKDFYQLWDLCKEIKSSNPSQAFKDIGLELVGPYEALMGKLEQADSPEDCLMKSRYYYDPPQFLTVLKGDSKSGYHIGYYYDHPDKPPTFLASNHESTDGCFHKMGENIFAALNSHLDEIKISGNPFQKMSVGRFRNILKGKSQKLNLDLEQHSENIKSRDKKVVAPTFNKLGLVVPYDRKTHMGYRDLAMTSKDLKTLLTKLKSAASEQKKKYLSELQPVLTFANIAIDECDFGTGVKLALDLLFFGIDDLNPTTESFFVNSFNLLQYDTFSKIAKAHLSNRKKLSVTN